MRKQWVKRLFDLCLTLPLLVLALPVIGLAALLLVLEDGFPIFFTQERVGLHGTVFRCYKLRSMKLHEPDPYHQVQASNPYVLRVGRFIRRFKIDELPQVWHVVEGKMSLVGPRPPLPELARGYTARQRRRFEMPPGLTGWAQVRGGTKLSWDERIELDIWYVDHWSLWLDMRILWMTLSVVLFGERLPQSR